MKNTERYSLTKAHVRKTFTGKVCKDELKCRKTNKLFDFTQQLTFIVLLGVIALIYSFAAEKKYNKTERKQRNKNVFSKYESSIISSPVSVFLWGKLSVISHLMQRHTRTCPKRHISSLIPLKGHVRTAETSRHDLL